MTRYTCSGVRTLGLFAILAFGACADTGQEQRLDQPQGMALRSAASRVALPGSCREPLPPPPGPCTIQVVMESIYVNDGQGGSEGDLELTVFGSTDGSTPVVWPSGGADPQRVNVGDGKTIGFLTSEHTLFQGASEFITVCAEVHEDDDGGLNGATDVGNVCHTMRISCDMGPEDIEITTPLCKGGKSPCNPNGSTITTFHVSISDEDQDGVPNPEDYAPTRCSDDARVLGQGGRAVLVYFHIPDEYLLQLMLDFISVDLDEAAEGYDYVALVMAPWPWPKELDPIDLSQKTVTDADLNVEPTVEGFFFALRDIVSKGYDVDIVIVGEGSRYQVASVVDDGQFAAQDGMITGVDIASRLNPLNSGSRTIPIRMVYTTASYNDLLIDPWLDVGAKAASGALQFNLFPIYQSVFSEAWNKGMTYEDALVPSNVTMIESISTSQMTDVAYESFGLVDPYCIYYLDHGLWDESEWLDSDDCNWEDFLVHGPFPIADYNELEQPLTNIRNSSELDRKGNLQITKSGALVW